MKLIKEYIRVFRHDPNLTDTDMICNIRAITSLLLALTAAVMSALNIARGFYVMATSTIGMTVVLLFCAYLSGLMKISLVSSVIISVMIAITFSAFAITGANSGFAVLWILLIPMFVPNLTGFGVGFFLSLYFLIFSFILSYTPASVLVAGKYSQDFIERFPLLYLCDFIISSFLYLQKEFYNRKASLASNTDELTDTYNRRYFTNRVLHTRLLPKINTCVMVIDINSLKLINDSLGHEAGDELICAVPKCCRKVIKTDFTLCRIGGDEFVVVLNIPDNDVPALVEEIKAECEKWRGKHTERCSLSVGWASSTVYPDENMSGLFKKADIHMYQNKSEHYRRSAAGDLSPVQNAAAVQ